MAIDVFDIITVDLLKNTMLAGIDLTLDDGSAYPDDLFEQSIAQAISMMQEELEITINPFSTKKERHDLDSDQARGFYPNQLDKRPLRSVDKLTISYGNYQPVEIPQVWINITSPEGGSVHLIPTAESVGTFNFNNVIPLLLDPMAERAYYSRVPGYFSYDYTSGFNFIEKTITIPQNSTEITGLTFGETLTDTPNFIFEIVDDGNGNNVGAPVPKIKAFGLSDEGFSATTSITPAVADMIIKVKIHTMPSVLVKCILYISAMLPLDTAGDLLLGAGIGQFSLAVDGLSQNIASTSSATSAGYGARILSYERQLKMALASVKKKYKVPKIAGGF